MRIVRRAIAVDAKRVEQFGKVVFVAGLVERAHRVLFVMCADKDDRPTEAGVFDRGGCDQEFAGKRAFQTGCLRGSHVRHAGLS
jgi:hypothetical protein